MLHIITTYRKSRTHYNKFPRKAKRATEGEVMHILCHESVEAIEFKQCLVPSICKTYMCVQIFWINQRATYGVAVAEIEYRKRYAYFIINQKAFDALQQNRCAAFANDNT